MKLVDLATGSDWIVWIVFVIFAVFSIILLSGHGSWFISGYNTASKEEKEKLEAEGHTIVQKGRKNIRYYVKDYEKLLFDLK